MLRLSATLANQPVASLRSGSKIAAAIEPVINPHNLQILGWWCKEPGRSEPMVLLVEDVRQAGPQGLVVDGEDTLSLPKDLVRHKEILDINFKLLGKTVKTKRSKIGKVDDFSYNNGMFVQKLYVTVPLTRMLTNNSTRVIDRTQIIEVTDHYILVKDTEIRSGAEEMAAVPA